MSALDLFPPPPPITWNYVLVVEWLTSTNDRRTGRYLVDWLSQNRPQVPTKYVDCRDAKDVERAIQAAAATIESSGTPILHIECHGGDSGIAGDAVCSTGFLEWNRLGNVLRPLNIATGFDLLLVSAACEGLRGILSFDNAKAAPFHAVVGFVTKVGEISLRDAMVEFYRCILTRNLDVTAAVDEANSQLHSPSTEMIHCTPAGRMAFDVVKRIVLDRLVEPGATQAALKLANIAISEKPSLEFDVAFESARRNQPSVVTTHLSNAWARWFAFDSVPANRKRFGVPMESMVKALVSELAPINKTQ